MNDYNGHPLPRGIGRNPTPIDPLPFPGGAVLPFDGGVTLWRLDPLPADAPDALYRHFNEFVALLRAMGHRVCVGDELALARSAAELLAEAWDARDAWEDEDGDTIV